MLTLSETSTSLGDCNNHLNMSSGKDAVNGDSFLNNKDFQDLTSDLNSGWLKTSAPSVPEILNEKECNEGVVCIAWVTKVKETPFCLTVEVVSPN